jgi:hypothetical protein
MTPLTCYLHVAQIGRWEPIARELIERIDAAGLAVNLWRTVIFWSGPDLAPRWLRRHGLVVPLGDVRPAGEVPTLREVYAACVANPDMGHVLYLHVKGASHKAGGPVDAWRDFLCAGVLGRWRDCVAALDDGCDAAGNEWYGHGEGALWRRVWGLDGLDFLPHFAGNFWWARADYVARLDPPPLCVRHDAEYRFVGVGNPRVHCPTFAGINWYAGR